MTDTNTYSVEKPKPTIKIVLKIKRGKEAGFSPLVF